MSALTALLRRLAALPGFRRLTRVPFLLRISFALRAHLVRERARFLRNELLGGRITADYTLAGSGLPVSVRHHTADVLILDELFAQQEYAMPQAVERAVAALPQPLRVADLGANIGGFGAWMLERFPDASILALEPDPDNAAIHRRVLEAAARGPAWELVEACAAASDGELPFASGRFTTSRVSEEAATRVPAVDAFPLLADRDFVKIDIEGGEWELLADERFRELPATVVALEYHDPPTPPGDARVVAEAALCSAGYEVVPSEQEPRFGAGLLWGIRR